MIDMLEMLNFAAPQGAPARPAAKPARHDEHALADWLAVQPVSLARHAAGLRPFTRAEFGNTAAAPSEGHLQAANALIERLRKRLLQMSATVSSASHAALRNSSSANLTRVVTLKDAAHDWVQSVEKVWDFYFELFGQRQTRFATWLLSCDRIALDCYQQAFLNVGKAKSIPAPPPFVYMKTGLSPATFRRSIRLRSLGLHENPFPLIQLPYHRLMNPWTLGAVLHEVSHNLQNDLDVDQVIPQTIEARLVGHGIPRAVAAVWKRWNREIFADLSGLLLGGPAVVGSLMDVVGRSSQNTLNFTEGAPHPTPWLRVLISCELLRRMDFPADAAAYRRAWLRLYPSAKGSNIPRPMLATFGDASAIVVDTICYRKYPQLGGKALSEVIRFAPKEQTMIEEAARRLAAGVDSRRGAGTLPHRRGARGYGPPPGAARRHHRQLLHRAGEEMTMTRATASAELLNRYRQLAETVRQLALAIDDAPEDGAEPAVVEALRVSAADAVHDTGTPLPQHDLATCQERVNHITRAIRQELASYEVLREIDRIAAERAGAWPRWSSVVREVLDRSENAVSETANALVACWRELDLNAHT